MTEEFCVVHVVNHAIQCFVAIGCGCFVQRQRQSGMSTMKLTPKCVMQRMKSSKQNFVR